MSKAKEAEDRHRNTADITSDSARLILGSIAYMLGFLLLFKLGLYVTGYGIYSLWFPAAGLRYAVLLVFGPRVWTRLLPLEILAALVLGVHEYWGLEHVGLAVIGLTAPTLLYALAAYVIRRQLNFQPTLDPCINLPIGFAGAVLAAGLSALVGGASLLPTGWLDSDLYWNAVASALTGDLVGIVTVTPACLAILQKLRQHEHIAINWRLAGEAAIIFAVTASLFVLISGPQLFPAWFITIFPVLWLAIRYGWAGAVLAVASVNLASATAAGFLPSAALRVQLQTFMLMQSLAALPIGGLTTARQITLDRLHRQKDALFHLERLSLLGQYAAELAHEMTQPLSAIAAYAKGGRTNDDPAYARQALTLIAMEADRLREIVRRTRILSQNKPPEFEAVDLRETLEELRPLLRIETKDTGAKISCKLPGDCPKILADKIQIQQVLLNLARNAITAVMQVPSEQRSITLDVSTMTDSFVVIAVTDSGRGLDTRLDSEQIFRPFVSSTGEGTGLGLAISRSIVEAHGGRIWVEAPESGCGTRVCISLPSLKQ